VPSRYRYCCMFQLTWEVKGVTSNVSDHNEVHSHAALHTLLLKMVLTPEVNSTYIESLNYYAFLTYY
jgi:hypothetical protein